MRLVLASENRNLELERERMLEQRQACASSSYKWSAKKRLAFLLQHTLAHTHIHSRIEKINDPMHAIESELDMDLLMLYTCLIYGASFLSHQ